MKLKSSFQNYALKQDNEQAKALLSKTMGSKSDDPEIYALYATRH